MFLKCVFLFKQQPVEQYMYVNGFVNDIFRLLNNDYHQKYIIEVFCCKKSISISKINIALSFK